MTTYKTLKPGDVLQVGDEYYSYGQWNDLRSKYKGRRLGCNWPDHRRPIIEVCDHIVGVDMPNCVVGLLLRKKRAATYHADDPSVTWFKHCPDCGHKLIDTQTHKDVL